jgi:DNA-binding transcriptional MerR regulator
MNEPFVPIEDVAKHFSVSISTVRAWVRQEHIPKDTYVKIGNTYRFRVGDVADALTTAEKNNSNGGVKTEDDLDFVDLDEDI